MSQRTANLVYATAAGVRVTSGDVPFRLFFLVCLLALAAAIPVGCGFKLRGAVEIPPEFNPMFIEASSGSAVRGAIIQRLEISQVRQAASAKDAKVILRILGESQRSRVAAVDGDGKVVAQELYLTVIFDAVDAQGEPLVNGQTLDLSRTYENPDVEVLGKQLEANLIYEDLVQDAADRILGRLRAVLL